MGDLLLMRRAAVALAVGALLPVLGGCGSEDPAPPAAEPTAFLPTTSPSPTMTMLPPPASFTAVDGAGFTISAPPEFQRREDTGSNGEPRLVLERPSGVAAVPQRVVVIRDVQPKQSAAEQSFALEAAKAAAGPEANPRRTQLPAPEGQSAFLTTWQEARASEDGGSTEVTYWQLMHQVDDSLILNVVALAPTEEFDSSDVGTILRTFVVDPGAHA